MKFTDGNWLMREGVQPSYPAQAYTLETTENALTAYAPAKAIRHRGDTLGGPVLTVKLSSPLADVIRVRLAHYSGGADAGPEFPLLLEDSPDVTIETSDASASLTSGRLSARIPDRNHWQLEFAAEGRVLTHSASRGMGFMQVAGEGTYVHEQLGLGVGEYVYGLGERFTAFVKNGQVVDTWNRDGGTGSDQAYKCVPFYLTNRGYGVFVNEPGAVSFEVASEKVSSVQFSVPGESLEYFVIYGPTPKEIIERYTALTGRPALPPAWTFGLWLTTSFTTSYDEETVTGFIEGMAARDLPLHVFHFDCFWMRAFHWCDFEWDPSVFPDPPAMLRRLHERGLKISVWINSYIAQQSALFAEGAQEGYFLKRANGDVWQTDQWQPGMAIVDFTNPAACRWFQDKLRPLVKMGVDTFKTDFGERIPTDAVYFDGSDPVKMHNFYTYLYNKTVFDLLVEELGVGQAALFARSATAGGQQFPIHWGGDCSSKFESMAESLRGGLSLCLSGFGFWSHDIGGFEGTPPASVYKRWIAFGLLSSHSRLHGSSSYRVPWVYDDEAVNVLRFFTKLKCRLMPYLYAAAVEAHATGIPVMRAMLLEFPNDPACETLDRQYLLGGSLLVAPVFAEDGLVDYCLPSGHWTEFLTGVPVYGGGWQRECHDYQSLPLLVRPHSVIPVGANDSRPDYDFAEGVVFQLYEIAEGGPEIVVTVPHQDGSPALTATIRLIGVELSLQVSGAAANWSALLVGIHEIASIDGGTTSRDPQGLRVIPSEGTRAMTITVEKEA